ncbi:MAG TPA: hypothetical protein EYG03_16625 [Planctomycetes bacterium]|nr:hypothetical protein [Fuerstiella sp.]HIK93575.1 hypothetical protein [Planctomycetota bacterium]
MQYVLFAGIAGLLGALLLGFAAAISTDPLPRWGRVLLVMMLLAPLPFALFGILASFEPGEGNWIPRIVFATIFLGCIASIVRLCRPRRGTSINDGHSQTR